jgi:general secretion pathway protein L
VRESAVIRLVGEEFVWYPAGAGGSPKSLSDPGHVAELEAIAAARRAPLVFAVPGADVVLREISYFASEKRHIVKSLPFLLEDDFAEDIETLHFSSRPLSRLSLGVAVCSDEYMQRWREMQVGLPALSQWIPEPLLLPWQGGELCIVIEADQIIVRSGVNSGFTVERELALTTLAALAGDAEFDAVIVYGTDQQSDQELLPQSLQAKLQWRSGDFSAALMLVEEESQPLSLNQGEYGAQLPLRRWWLQWRLVAGLFVAAFGLQLASTWTDYNNLHNRNLYLRQQIEVAYREAVPRGAVVDPEKQLQRQLDTLRGGAPGAGFVSLLDRIGRVVQAQKGSQIATINFNDKVGDVRLNLVVPDFKAVESIRNELDKAGLLAQMENSNTQGDVVRARLKVREK